MFTIQLSNETEANLDKVRQRVQGERPIERFGLKDSNDQYVEQKIT